MMDRVVGDRGRRWTDVGRRSGGCWVKWRVKGKDLPRGDERAGGLQRGDEGLARAGSERRGPLQYGKVDPSLMTDRSVKG